MKEYKVLVSEVLQRQVKVKADSEKEAKDKVKDMYFDEKIILNDDDLYDYNIEVLD